MSVRVKREELKTGHWYQVRQGSVLIPMFLRAWISATEVEMCTRNWAIRRVSILNIVEGWDQGSGSIFELPKSGEPTPAGAASCPGCRLCQSSQATARKPPEPGLDPGTAAYEVLRVFAECTSPLHQLGITDSELEAELPDYAGGSVRGRRAELVRIGYIEATADSSRTMSGRPTRVWRITVAGEQAWADAQEAVSA